MDLSKLNVTAAADSAKRFEILDPFDGTPLTDEDGTELAVYLLAGQSTVARNHDAAMWRDLPNAGKKKDELTEDEQKERDAYTRSKLAAKLAAMVTKLEGKWELGSKPITAKSKAALTELIESQEWLANQLMMRSNNLKAYRPEI